MDQIITILKFMIKRKLFLLCAFFIFFHVNNKAQEITIIPWPQKVDVGQGTFTINSQTKIVYSGKSIITAKILQSDIRDKLGFQNELVELEDPGRGNIFFKNDKTLAKETYQLVISKNKTEIFASDNVGWFYGVQSLIQLFPEMDKTTAEIKSIEIPVVTITDVPRFAWRAFMLDEGRYFKGMAQIKLLLDEMARLKMNVFHWHLVENEGWRIEIKKYPLLTEIGSKRKSSQIGPSKWDSPMQSGEPHEGFYTQEEIKEIIKYAEERHITIVPEIEMPGHSTAAIAAYPWLGTEKSRLDVPTKFGVSDDVYDVSDPRCTQFLTDVLDEIVDLFPSKVIHIGGDEVKYDDWKKSESVQAYMKDKNLTSPADLQIFFTNNISYYLQSKGRRMMGWNEIMGHHLHEYQSEIDTKSTQKLAKESIIHFWKGDADLAVQAASNGYEIVNSHHNSTYIDYSYDDLTLSRAYAFDPIPEGLDPKYHNKIIGLGCQMWGEWIPTVGSMHFMVFPRIAAFAEVGWTEKGNKDYERFTMNLKKLENHWEQKGIYFAPFSFVEKNMK